MKLDLPAVAGLFAWLLAMLFGSHAQAQCTKDVDCKGTRVCIDGKCEEPATPPASPAPAPPVYEAPAYPQPPAYPPPPPAQPRSFAAPEYQAATYATPSGPRWYDAFYGHIGLLLGLHGWGSESGDFGNLDLSGKLKTGLTMAVFFPVWPNLHFGGYLDYSRGDIELDAQGRGTSKATFDDLSVGYSFKGGAKLQDHIWLGFAGDFGVLYRSPSSGGDSWLGFEISPRIHMDVLAVDLGGLMLGPFVSFGPSISPYLRGFGDATSGHGYLVYLQLRLGATFGT